MGPSTASTPSPRIVVGIDGSEHAAAALVTAIRLARALGAEVVAVHAIPPPALSEYRYGMLPIELDPAWREEIHRQFEQEWCRPLEEAGVRYRALERDGWPAAVLREVAEAEDADLVVVGRRGRGRVTELLLGSVSHELSHTCRRPVLLVTGPRERGQERNRAGAGRPPAG
jgi:nucleotide-binding universal stress UspA family protein